MLLKDIKDKIPFPNNKIKVYSFVGPSGTGKSYRAQMVASERNIEFIIDDGLLINNNQVVAGESAKKAPTKIETVKHALFYKEEEKQEITKALKKYKPQSILILGTSDGMVDKIAANLGLPEISERVYITDVATEQEMQTARKIRVTEGKHVIPVPTFEIKKDFSGYLLDPLQIFKSKGRGQKPYISEKSIIRPTFSYLGNFTISDTVFRQILDYLANNTKAINRVMKTRVDNLGEGVDIYMEVEVVYGFNVMEGLTYFKQKAKKEIEKLTAMNVVRLEVIAKSVYVPEKKVYLNGENVTTKIRSKEVSKIVSQVSSIKEVRFKMVDLQRRLAEGKDVIMEGRDIGTYVFPNANVKIYLDATAEERAKRRYLQNQEAKIEMEYDEILQNIKMRDKNDMEKEIGALKKAPDAVYIDSSNLSITQVKDKIIEIIKEKK